MVIGAPGWPAGGSSSQRLRHTSLGGRGVLPRWWSVLKEELWGEQLLKCSGSPAWGDGESCLGGSRYSNRACGW